uniref:Outer dense fiber of sperm tails 2 like n=1 Tax=Pelusios castaneus TaxID=367368 RepID=A0A8C8RCY4_9SAUR
SLSISLTGTYSYCVLCVFEQELSTFVSSFRTVCNLSTSDMIKISKQEDLLIKELETFKHVKGLLLHLLRETEQCDNTMYAFISFVQASAPKADHLSKSVEAVHAHLQCQIQKKEAENYQLKAKIQTLERKISEWKLRIGEHKHQILTVKETNEQKKKALKKAARAQKQRAKHFEASVENLTSKIRKREIKLSEVLSASSVWKNHHEKAVEEKTGLEVQTETLKKQVTNLLEDLKKIQDHGRNSNEKIREKLNSVNSENANIYLENAKLKALLAALEDNTVSVEAELLTLQEEVKQQGNLAEQYKTQVTNRPGRLKYQFYMDDNNRFLRNHSLEEENCNIQKKYEYLKRQLEKMDIQNEELAHQLANKEESLQLSKLQIQKKLAEYDALARQLEAALEEGRKKESEEVEKMLSKERALQTKILVLETELRERQEEQKRLVFKLNSKQQEVRLKELEHNLQKSENQNHSIQNYVQFLKTSYVTMFG